MNHTPATPLPWVGTCLEPGPNRPAPGVVSETPRALNGYRRVARAGNPGPRCRQDMKYIVQACNAYPDLIREILVLRNLVFAYQEGTAGNLIEMPRFKASADLLRKLGEEVS